jgi:SSS family solute:Na+ symporter
MLIISAIITLIITGIIGYLSKSRVKTSRDFISGGSKLGVMGVTSMLMGSIIGGAGTVGTAQMAYNRGIGAMWFIVGLSIASILLGLFYSTQVNKKSIETIPQIIGNAYGKKARTISSILLSIGMFIHINGQVIACTALFTVVFGMSIIKTAVIVVCLLVAYVVFGGFWGSTMVGAVKTILLYGTSIICGILLIFKFNGIREITSILPQEPWFNLFSGGISSDIASGLSTIVGVLSTQTYFQAIMAGKNSKISRRSAFFVAFLILPVGIVCTMIGMYMRIHHPSIAASEAFPLFLMNYLNPVLGGVCIATVLISSIATGAGLTLGIATMFVRDIYIHYINKKAGDKKQLYILRGTIIFIGFMSLLIVINNKDSMILNWGFLSMIFRATPIFIPVVVALFFRDRVSMQAGIYSIIAGPLASLIWILLGFGKLNSIYIGLTINAFVLFGMSRFYKTKGRDVNVV